MNLTKIFATFLTIFTLTTFASAEKIKLTSLDWQPYVGKNIPENGFVTEIIKAAYQAAGESDVQVFFLPWEKCVDLARIGNADAYYPEYYNKDLESEFIFSDPIICGPLTFMKLKTTEFNYTGKVEELKPYKIGVVAGYINTKEIDNADYLTKIEAKDDLSNIQNLLAGKAHVIIVDPLVAFYCIENDKVMAPSKEKVEIVKPILDNKELFIAFSKKAKDINSKLEKFNDGLKKIKTSTTITDLLKKYKVQDIITIP